ncbi:hypothetical protein GCM10028803_16790 [Larkinella knui]|uniref:ZU5 domain-containing protein n=1 Tax=Larkinella knui TaxID=2025310 RepID=A0A3P1CU59_9BACT|nr:hypothetical protein [Larkinella knui]RRB16799.1 hypothetical protein EHT87_00465 [Larkinella knui]
MKTLVSTALVVALISLAACQKPEHAIEPPDETTDNERPSPTALGQPIGSPVTKTVGPAGGTITTPDGKLTLNIPAGALSKETPISVQAVENKAPNGSGTAYQFGTEAVHLAQPVTVEYAYAPGELSGAVKGNVGLAHQNKQGEWGLSQLAKVDPAKRKLTARIAKVSDEAIAFIEQYRLTPAADTLVYLQERDFKIEFSSMGFGDVSEIDGKPVLDNFIIPLPGAVRDANAVVVRRYGINGDQYGSTRDGTFELLKDAGKNPNARAWFTYQAPSDAPSGNPVALFVELEHGGKEKLMLVSNVYIKNPVGFRVDGKDIKPVRAAGAITPGALTVIVSQDASTTFRNQLSLFVYAPKVGKFSFNYGDAAAVLVYGKNTDYKEYASSYVDKDGKTVYMDGEIILTEVDRNKGVVSGSVHGTVVHKKSTPDGYVLEPVKITGEFQCKLGY